MQKVVGSSPIIRSKNPLETAGVALLRAGGCSRDCKRFCKRPRTTRPRSALAHDVPGPLASLHTVPTCAAEVGSAVSVFSRTWYQSTFVHPNSERVLRPAGRDSSRATDRRQLGGNRA